MTFEEWRKTSEWNGNWHDEYFARDAWEAATAAERERCVSIANNQRLYKSLQTDEIAKAFSAGVQQASSLIADEIRKRGVP